jgi:ABC-type sugar transport system substrate-binding protein
MTGRETASHIRGAVALLLAGLALVLVAAGCGSSGSSSGGGGSSNGQSAASGADVAGAEKLVKQYETRPTKIPVSQPIGKPVPKGKKVFDVSCGIAACVYSGQLEKQATDMLGWSNTVIATDGTPQQLTNGVSSAIRSGANAIWIDTGDPNELAASIKEARDKGVFFGVCCSSATMPDQVDFTTLTPPQIGPYGKALAAEVVADSKGKANALYVDLPAFPILAKMASDFKSTYQSLCPKCVYGDLGIPPTSLGKDAPDRIVSYLRAHPGVNYLVLSQDTALLPGLVPALKTAGFNNIKMVGQGGDSTVYQAVRDGDMLAITPNTDYDLVFSEVDAMARHFAGVKVLPTVLPIWLVTKDNIPDTSSGSIAFVEDFKAQYAKLCGVSG